MVVRGLLAITLLAVVASCSATDSATDPAADPATGDASPTDDLCAAWIATTTPPGDSADPRGAVDGLLAQAESVRSEVPDEHLTEIDAFVEQVRELRDLGDETGWTPEGFQAAAPPVQARLKDLNESLIAWGSTSPLADHAYGRCAAAGAEDPKFHLACVPSRFQPIPQPAGARLAGRRRAR